MKVLAVLSGGMDSTCALYKAMKEGHEIVKAVAFDYGSKHNKQEHKYAKQTCEKLDIPFKVINLDFSEFESDLLISGGDIPEGHYADPNMKKTVVPFRNGIMLAFSTGIAESCGAEAIMLGNHFGDHAVYPDCRKDFVEAMSQAMTLGTYEKIKLYAPFTEITKTDIAVLGDKLGVDWSLTYSCYNGRDKHCGKCGTCVERIEAFHDGKVNDPTEYE